jgi:hypothetical protein
MIMRVHLPHKIKKINEKSEQVFMLAKAPLATGFIGIGPHQLWALIPIKPHGQGLKPNTKISQVEIPTPLFIQLWPHTRLIQKHYGTSVKQ